MSYADDEVIERRNMEWIPVRCCCTPRKIFGFLHVPRSRGGALEVLDDKGNRHRIQTKSLHEGRLAEHAVLSEIAVYSEDRPLEFWRTIAGFVEASGT